MKELEQALDNGRLDILVTDMIEKVCDQYAIKKVPKNGTLKDCLAGYTKEKLLHLAAENGFKVRRSWRKAKIVQYIEDGILASIEERFLILGKRKLTLLQQMSNGKFETDELTLEEVEFYLSVYPAAVRMGLLYSSIEKGQISTILSGDIKLHLDGILANFNHLKREFSLKIQQWNEMEEVLHAGVHLYGTMSTHTVTDLWENRYGGSEQTEEEVLNFIRYSREILPLLIIDNGYYLLEGSVIGSSQFVDTEDVENFYYYVKDKMDIDKYEPSKEEIQYYAEHSFDRRTRQYEKLEEYI